MGDVAKLVRFGSKIISQQQGNKTSLKVIYDNLAYPCWKFFWQSRWSCFVTSALNLVQVLFVGVECEAEVEDLELAVVARPHQVGGLEVGVNVVAHVQSVQRPEIRRKSLFF